MKTFYNLLTAAIAALSATGLMAQSAAEQLEVGPLLETAWYQSDPYNRLCPEIETETDGKRYPTGCVATAMAQVMRYYGHPTQGTGSVSYYAAGKQLQADFSQSTYAWNRMLPYYGDVFTDDQADAVALIMRDAGYATRMNYQKDGSGTILEKAVEALTEHFGYSKAAFCYSRNAYSTSQWEEMIRAELAAGRPVLYEAMTKEFSGHSFIIDGCRAGGTFHINWGWSGQANGWYHLGNLLPDRPGTNSDAYSLSHQAIMGIQPGAGGEAGMCVKTDGGLSMEATTDNDEPVFICSAMKNGYTTYFTFAANAEIRFALRLTNETTGDVVYADATETSSGGFSGGFCSTFKVSLQTLRDLKLADGSYLAEPMFRRKSGANYQPVGIPSGYCRSYRLSKADGGASWEAEAIDRPGVVKAEIKEVSPMRCETPYNVKVQLKVEGDLDVSQEYAIGLFRKGQTNYIARSETRSLTLSAGKTATIDFTGIWDALVAAGDYELALVAPLDYSDEDEFSTRYPISLAEKSAVEAPTLALKGDVTVIDKEGKVIKLGEEETSFDINAVEIQIPVTCTAGSYADRLYAYLSEEPYPDGAAERCIATMEPKAVIGGIIIHSLASVVYYLTDYDPNQPVYNGKITPIYYDAREGQRLYLTIGYNAAPTPTSSSSGSTGGGSSSASFTFEPFFQTSFIQTRNGANTIVSAITHPIWKTAKPCYYNLNGIPAGSDRRSLTPGVYIECGSGATKKVIIGKP